MCIFHVLLFIQLCNKRKGGVETPLISPNSHLASSTSWLLIGQFFFFLLEAHLFQRFQIISAMFSFVVTSVLTCLYPYAHIKNGKAIL